MDKSREYDLKILEERKERANSTRERERYDRKIHEIYESSKNESIRKDRERLINAHAHNDYKEAEKLTEEMSEKYGRRNS